MKIAPYLVQSKDGVIHTYWTLEILLIDLAVNREHPPAGIYKLMDGLRPKYVPVAEASLRAELKETA